MERFNSNEEAELSPEQIAKQLVYSDDYNDRENLVKLFAQEIKDAYDRGRMEVLDEY